MTISVLDDRSDKLIELLENKRLSFDKDISWIIESYFEINTIPI
ncbi:hypothetical protein RINTHH_1800 [Richelia intracellularis HH01]|uniref:Uncharacterized protein n=1 Tax=Richelia intracellularis HH01 TaxID=1165094 RepID=M1X275_9NOST|nr:hypothetical protein [Richelia intracellularis]CCH66335.1 hypothetical protein RINTHH_1800 [Richelia intracellularis HH01]